MSERDRDPDPELVDPSANNDPWRDNELVRRHRIRDDAKRPMAVNLREAMELSEFLCSVAGAARRR